MNNDHLDKKSVVTELMKTWAGNKNGIDRSEPKLVLIWFYKNLRSSNECNKWKRWQKEVELSVSTVIEQNKLIIDLYRKNDEKKKEKIKERNA